MTIDRRIVEPAKLALAIAIIYAISFYMGWHKPYWATVSAISVNLLSTGLTLHRGMIRVLGTAIGGFMGLAVIGIFPQERWAYLIVASAVLLVLGYKATGKKEPYFYLIILITFIVVMAVVQSADYTDSGHAFEVVMLRVTQTLMGSFVMAMIMVYVFPYRTVDEFEDLCRVRWSIQRKLYNAYRGMLFGEEEAEDTKPLRMEDAPLLELAHFKLHGAEQDSFEMLELGHDWHHYLDLTAAQYNALDSLRQSLTEVRDLDLTQYLPNLEAVRAELDHRFEQTERMLNKQEPTEFAHHFSVSLDEDKTRELSHFKEAAVRVIKSQLEALEEVSLSLFNGVARIRSFEAPDAAHDDHHGHDHGHGHGGEGVAIDGFRLVAAIAFVASVWVSFLLWIYVYDMPRASLFPCFVVITASILMYRPEANHVAYAGAWLIGAVAAAPLYLFILQHLSGYLEFAVVIFIGIFLIQYILYPHVHPMVRIFVTIGFTIVVDAENHMHYDLQHYLQTVLWMATVLLVTLFVRFSFISRRPDVLFMKVLNQFFSHADFMLSAYDADGKPDRSLGRRLRSVFFRYSLLQDAHMLSLFAGQVDLKTGQISYKMLRETPPEDVQALVRSVYALGHRIESLVEAREASPSSLVEKYLADEKREWTDVLQEWFRHRPGEAQTAGPDNDLTERLNKLEKRIDEAYAQLDEGELSTEDYENFYRRLGHYRGLSEAAGDYARIASRFDWPRWQETRF